MERQYDICYSSKCQIFLSQKLSSIQAFLRQTVLLIPGGRDHERITLNDDLHLPSNHKRSFTGVMLYDVNVYDVLYL